MQKLAKADMLVVNGLGMEEFLGAPVKKANANITVIDSSMGIKETLDYSEEHHHGDDHGHDHSEAGHHAEDSEHDHDVHDHDQEHHPHGHDHHHSGANPHLFASPRMTARKSGRELFLQSRNTRKRSARPCPKKPEFPSPCWTLGPPVPKTRRSPIMKRSCAKT
jgi:ABC-type Zn2+ transport system substrate-binding protein/surface adhesin